MLLPHDSEEATVRALLSGCMKTGARTISRVERGDADIVPILQALYRSSRDGRVVGVTGPPGAGKSSLVNKLVGVWRRRGASVAVLAVDPSSPFTGGAVLGDRVRMTDHGNDEGVFIRSMASRGQLGGLAKAAGDAITVLEAMPWDVVVVETVGAGQNETEIMRYASVVVLVQTPMGGDEVQATKAGINEIGDIFVVNKSDHPEAGHTCSQLENMIALANRRGHEFAWRPPVVKTQSLTGEGIETLADHVERWFQTIEARPDVNHDRSRGRVRHRVGEIVRDMLDRRIRAEGGQVEESLIDRVVARESDPYALAARLLADAR